jgi:hypothetical protein
MHLAEQKRTPDRFMVAGLLSATHAGYAELGGDDFITD